VVTGAASFPAYIARRLVLLVFTMVLVPSLSFVMFTLIQGDVTAPLDVLGELADYLSATFLHGSAGSANFQSATYRRTRDALEVIQDGFVVDCYLLGGAILLGVLIGLSAGSVQATRPRAFVARVLEVLTAFGLSVPVYWLGLMVLLLFAPGLGSVAQIPFLSTVGAYRDPASDAIGFLRGLWLPALIVATPLAAACARMATSQLRGVLQDDYVRTARGKGVGRRSVVWRHALPASAGPVVALVGVNMNLILTNVALIETVFNIPGAFRYIERALINRDVDLVQALVVEATFFIVVANFAVDAIQAWLDPRMRGAEPA
jgi:peptide/nickel transport system permease protein